MTELNIDFSLPENWHIKPGQEPKAVLYVEPLAEAAHAVEIEAMASLAQYLPSADGSATLATHKSAAGDYFYQKAYGQWNKNYADVMNSLRLKLIEREGTYMLLDEELDRSLDSANPNYWQISRWEVSYGEAPNKAISELAGSEKWFFFDKVIWKILLEYPEGKQWFQIETNYAWPIYR